MALEFQSHRDDAWYEATLLTEPAGDEPRLRIKFDNFSDSHDELVNVKDLKSLKDVEAFKSRVRRVSPQLQDHECSNVHKGFLVCAAHSVAHDRRFFDGVVHAVVRKEHRIVKGEELCSCKFMVEWTNGPDVGIQTSLAVGNICRVLNEEVMSPVLSSFLNRAKEKIEGGFSNSTAVSVEKGGCDSGSSGISRRFKAPSARRLNKDTPARRYVAALAGWSSTAPRQESADNLQELQQKKNQEEVIDNPSERTGLEMDIEGLPHVLCVENLEKGILPVTIERFIYEQVSVLCKAFVMPSKPSESYTRGLIILDNKMDLEKLSNFLENPDRIIVSSRGRPWIVPEHVLDDTLRAMTQDFRPTSQTIKENNASVSKELKVVISGSREYQKAEMLKKLIKDFVDHQCRLHKRLLYDEAKISKLPG
ncbi:uncharacterized protein LOC126788692 [Argentina anserina]|uniref:uncharacterized protein LOC126788692 n=1 Tax=Argentina anserina TaxID=57926 RepID=UPI0021766C8B|nr:uncharacterized protein LOC126788692 [Potentilla anserina]